MQSNAISKISEDTTNSNNYNLNIYTHKMAIVDVSQWTPLLMSFIK